MRIALSLKYLLISELFLSIDSTSEATPTKVQK